MTAAPAPSGASGPWPVELRLLPGKQVLEIDYDDGARFSLPAEYLRVESPSAEVQGHGPGQKRLPRGKSEVRILAIDRVGRYAVRLRFDDGHDTGLYTWPYLRQLGEEQPARMAAYRTAVAE